ncbi:hypothetical protein KV557_32730 [Kitasatospora aureofaciens]|uniref:TniQ family protein n=1 Tax=Kitasatospora aureofaciens TaxID=1894 RepID=UPI001C43D3CA|nr:TniQ family protein [Kitasatospora aureofaciens]MBV6701815.1 hypothetical protein [Kitasatospora aureofaciens]
MRRHHLWGRANGSRFCPSCLTDSCGRWQLSWRLGWSFACTVHNCLLADVCWQCQRHQRRHLMPSGTIPIPGQCTNPGGTVGRSATRCGADLTQTPVLPLPDGYPVLRTQHLIIEAITAGTTGTALHPNAPVADFLSDIRSLSKLILTHPDHNEPGKHLPADIADTFDRARDLPHSRASPSTSRVRPGFAAPARAEITAAVTTIAARALTLDSTDQAADALAWLFVPKTGAAAGKATTTVGHGASELLLDLQHTAMHRPTTSTGHTRSTSPDRTRRIPGLLWPTWTVALAPPHRHPLRTFQNLQHALSVLLALIGPGGSVHEASRRLGACYPPDDTARLLHRLQTHPNWQAAETALSDLAQHLDRVGSPIDYQRRRQLDYRDLLPVPQWQALARRALHLPGNSHRPLTARRWLFERISGLPATHAPTAYALTEHFHRNQISDFTTVLSPQLLAELDAHAIEFLNQQGIHDEPATWCPPTTGLTGPNLPGTDLGRCRAEEIHHLLRNDRLRPRDIAARLDVSIDAVRCTLTDQPAPLASHQLRWNGRLVPMLSQQLTAQELQRLYHDERLSVAALSRRFGVSRRSVSALLDHHGIQRRSQPPRPIDLAWLRHEYVVRRRTLADLADELGISARYLGRRAREMGIPTRTWVGTPPIRNRRFELHHLRAAQVMLGVGNYSVRKIAEELGFSTRTVHRHLHAAGAIHHGLETMDRAKSPAMGERRSPALTGPTDAPAATSPRKRGSPSG